MASATSGNGEPGVVKKTRQHREVGARVRLIRIVQGYETAEEFAGVLGVKRARLTNIENGFPLSIDVALRLVDAVPGLTLDWLYRDRSDFLTVDLARRIQAAARNARK